MKKSLKMFFFTAVATLMASPAFAETAAAQSGGNSTKVWFFITVAILTSVCMALVAIGTGWSQSKAIRSAVEGIARNPGAGGTILTTMLIGIAMIEALAIYVLVIALILLLANQFTALL